MSPPPLRLLYAARAVRVFLAARCLAGRWGLQRSRDGGRTWEWGPAYSDTPGDALSLRSSKVLARRGELLRVVGGAGVLQISARGMTLGGPTEVAVTEIKAASSSASGTVSWTAGNALVACAGSRGANANPSMSGGGGTWTQDTTGHTGTFTAAVWASISSNPNPTGTSATLTVSATSGQTITAMVYEVAVNGGTFAQDATSPAAKTGTTVAASTNSLSNVTGSAIFLALAATSSTSATSTMTGGTAGWTYPAAGVETNGTAGCVLGTGYRVVTSTGSQSSAWTVDNGTNWVGLIAVYKSPGPAWGWQPLEGPDRPPGGCVMVPY